MKLCFATNNKGKLQEIQALLSDHEIVSLKDIGCFDDLPETQDTIEGNSLQKAEYIWNKFKVNCFADDTGLVVPALNGEPGVYSARYAGPECIAENNMDLLLSKLNNKENRDAYFITCITLILEGEAKQFKGKAEGKIITEKRGQKGFGYDPIFQPNGLDKTFAELPLEEKNKISHRAKAVRALVDFLGLKGKG